MPFRRDWFGVLGIVVCLSLAAELTAKPQISISVRKRADAASRPASGPASPERTSPVDAGRRGTATRPASPERAAPLTPGREAVPTPGTPSGKPAKPGPASQPAKPPPRGSAYAAPNNFFGAHLLVSDGMIGTRGYTHLQWARRLVGQWGYAKTLFSGIDAKTAQAQAGWVDYVKRCYELDLIPVIRLGGHCKNGQWLAPQPDEPGDYASMAEAIKRVVRDLPRSDMCPLYIEVWNEPNLPIEWSGQPNPKEYADFFVQAADAIRSIEDKRIRILNGGLASDPAWVEALCQANPRFAASFDVWASHPYPANRPPSVNHHDKTAPVGANQTIDAYLLELDVLRRFGRSDVKVMITETGHDLGNGSFTEEGYPIIDEVNRADYMVRAFRDYWSKWPEIVAVIPFEFCGEGWERFDWVYPASETTPEGVPTRAHQQYHAVAALAKPTDATATISGRVTVEKLGTPLEGARVVAHLQSKGAVTDALGNYLLPGIGPEKYVLIVSKTGYKTVERKVAVKAGNVVCDVALAAEKTEPLVGTVVSGDDGKPLKGIRITLEPGHLSTFTDMRGRYEFPECVPAKYAIRATGRDLVEYRAAIEVFVRKHNQHDFAMGRSGSKSAENLIRNNGFEAGGGGAGKADIGLGYEPQSAGDYREGVCSISERIAHTGRRSQEIRLKDAFVVRQIGNYGAAAPGQDYVAGAWVRLAAADDDATAWISLAACRNDGSVIGESSPSDRRKVTSRAEGWTWVEVHLTAPAGSERLSLSLHAQGRRGEAYFDDLLLSVANEKKRQ